MLPVERFSGVAEFDQIEIGTTIISMCSQVALACGTAVSGVSSELIGHDNIVRLGAGFSFMGSVEPPFTGIELADSLSIEFCPEQNDHETPQRAITFDFGLFTSLEKITYWGGNFGMVELRPTDDGRLLMHTVDDEADQNAFFDARNSSITDNGLIDAKMMAKKLRDYKEGRVFTALTPDFVEEFMPFLKQAISSIETEGLHY